MFDGSLIRFVREHAGDDTSRLLLSHKTCEGVDVSLAASCIESRRKLAHKCPRWAADDILCPLPLSAEQCSSEAAAAFKAKIAEDFCKERLTCDTGESTPGTGSKPRIADLTSGLGVDCAAFAGIADRVLYNDMRPVLCNAAEFNFAALGISNADFSCNEIGPESALSTALDFGAGLVYLDPARRSAAGGKLYRLADCSPDILGIVPPLLAAGIKVMVKISPMADITQICRELEAVGAAPQTIWVVGAGGECKELLLLIAPTPSHLRGTAGQKAVRCDSTEPEICVACEVSRPDNVLRFKPSEEKSAPSALACHLPDVGEWIFEPCKALVKAGCRNLLCSRWGIRRLGPDLQIYTAPEPVEDAAPFGRWCRITESLPIGGQTIKSVGESHPGAELLARGLKIDTDALRTRMKLRGGGSERIYALGCGALGKRFFVTLAW